MILPSHVRDAISAYHARYRNAELPPPEVSEVYALFPDARHAGPWIWPMPWQHAGRPGVYLIFGPNEELLYIGKDTVLGRRLGTYFRYGDRRACKIVDETAWMHRPTFVVTIALSETFEAPSLEEFLITRIESVHNKTWSGARVSAP